METKPLIVERTYNATIEKVWKAITDKDQMKEWYFDLQEFRPETGFKFSFTGGDDTVQYLHECEVILAEPLNKLSYSWTYPEHNNGYSVVTFELFKENEKKTRLRLTHEGLYSFPKDDPNFSIANFTEGWSSILGDSLKNYVETDIIKKSVPIVAAAEVIWNILLTPNKQWGKAFGGGALVQTDWEPGSEVVWTDTEGNLAARGIVKEHRKMDYLQVDMYDDVNAAAGSETGEYAEKYSLAKNEGDSCILDIESGPIPKKYTEEHGRMWDGAIKIIKDLSESK
jgi:uncharacterized protein YndB with AHSA1/START domain